METTYNLQLNKHQVQTLAYTLEGDIMKDIAEDFKGGDSMAHVMDMYRDEITLLQEFIQSTGYSLHYLYPLPKKVGKHTGCEGINLKEDISTVVRKIEVLYKKYGK